MPISELMTINWQNLVMPGKVHVTSSPGYGKFVCEPLERGFGITIGNTLRRILLSSLHGAAIVSVKFEEVMHEFSVIPGVLEDVSEIILNLKSVRVKVKETGPHTIRIQRSGECTVKAGDIISEDGHCEILNPDLHIATLSEKASLNMTMTVKVGKGFALSEVNKDMNEPVGTIPIDSVFSPINKVVYVVGNARVGQRTDYDKLTMDVWTDGSVLPEDAVSYAAKIMKEQLSKFINFDEPVPIITKTGLDPIDPLSEEIIKNLHKSVEELELSVRSANCLKNADILKVYQLVTKTEAEMLKTKNFGRKSLNEIKTVLTEMKLSLGMKMPVGFNTPEDDIQQGE
jgi:DNA-directed RNA polymerase subunit alpha